MGLYALAGFEMKGARFILPGCTGFNRRHPEWGEFLVQRVRGYNVLCTKLDSEDLSTHYIPMRDFEVLDFPKDENKP